MTSNKDNSQKPRCFIMFADLDGTFTPMDIEGKIDFINVVREIQEREKVQVKFVPVSGRPAGYVLRVLHETRDMLLGVGIKNVCDYGAAEQGALIVDSSRSYAPYYTGHKKNIGLKQKIGRIVEANEYHKIVSDEPDKLYTCSIHIKNEPKSKMTIAEQMAVYHSIKKDIVAEFGDGVLDISMSHNCMEVMTKEISKAFSMNLLITEYRRDYDIVGLLYGGDAENDKIAMMYVSKLAELPGLNAHNFIPSNAQDAVDSWHVEPWKRENKAAHKHYVEKGSQRLFLGISELIRKAMDEGRLCGIGVERWETRDDSALLEVPQQNGPMTETSLKKICTDIGIDRTNSAIEESVAEVKRLNSELNGELAVPVIFGLH